MAGKTNPGRAACTDGTTTRTLTKTNAKTPASLTDILSPKRGASGPAILICQNSTRVLPYSLPEAQSHETKTDKSIHVCLRVTPANEGTVTVELARSASLIKNKRRAFGPDERFEI